MGITRQKAIEVLQRLHSEGVEFLKTNHAGQTMHDQVEAMAHALEALKPKRSPIPLDLHRKLDRWQAAAKVYDETGEDVYFLQTEKLWEDCVAEFDRYTAARDAQEPPGRDDMTISKEADSREP